MELQQCYKAQARLSEQLVVEVAESRASKSLLQEKETLITDLQNELNQARCYSHASKTFDVLNYTLPFATKKKHVKSNKRTKGVH